MEDKSISPCPFCGDKMMVSNGGLVQHIHQGSCFIGAISFAYEHKASLEKWNRRAGFALFKLEMEHALLDATAHLVGAASAYRTFAKRSPGQGKAETDALFSTRASDFDKAAKRAQNFLRKRLRPNQKAYSVEDLTPQERAELVELFEAELERLKD